MLDLRFWQKINTNVVARYRKAIFDPAGGGRGAKDVYGKPYRAYSTHPSKWTSMSMKKSARGLIPKGGISYAVAKKSGQLKKQQEKFRDSRAPVLSGSLMNDFQLRKTSSKGFSFGTVSWGSTAKFLSDMGRVIADDQKLPKKVVEYIMDQADKYVLKKLGKIKGGTFNI